MVQPRSSRRPPSGKNIGGAHRNSILLPASREIAQLRSLLCSKFNANEAAFEVLRGLGTPVQAACGKRYAVVSAERQPTLFEVLRSLDFKVDIGTVGKGATMTVEDEGANQRHPPTPREMTSWQGLRPNRPASAPQQRESSPAAKFVSAQQGPAPAASARSKSVDEKVAEFHRRARVDQCGSAIQEPSSDWKGLKGPGYAVGADRPTRPLSARLPPTKQEEVPVPIKSSAQPVDVPRPSFRPASARPASQPPAARQEPVMRPVRPLSAKTAQSNGDWHPHSYGMPPTLMDVLGLGQRPPPRPTFAPPRPTSARSSSEQRVASARLARPRSARSAPQSDDSAKPTPSSNDPRSQAQRQAQLLAEARREDSVRRRAGMHPESESHPDSWAQWHKFSGRKRPGMHSESRQDSSESLVLRADEPKEISTDYKPGAWHRTLDDPQDFEDELKALQARVDDRVAAARNRTEDASPSSGRATPRRSPRSSVLESRIAAAKARLRSEDGVPDIQASMSLQAALARVKAGHEAFPERDDVTNLASQFTPEEAHDADLTLVPHAVQLHSMAIQPPELLETLRARSQAGCEEPGDETQPTQSLCYSRSFLSDPPADRTVLKNSVVDALESKGEHKPRNDSEHDCTMLVLEKALTGGA